MLRIEMYDEEEGCIIPEYFYWIIVSHNYNKKKGEHFEITLRQEELDILEVTNLIKERLADFRPTNWDTFYEFMSTHFIYDD